MTIILNVIIWERHSGPKQKKTRVKKQRKKQNWSNTTMLRRDPWQCTHSDQWLLRVSPGRLWLLQGRGLHGNHYSRFHVLNKRDCGTDTNKSVSESCNNLQTIRWCVYTTWTNQQPIRSDPHKLNFFLVPFYDILWWNHLKSFVLLEL